MKKLEFSLYDCVFQKKFKFFLKNMYKFNLYDSSALCCIFVVLSLISKKEINIWKNIR